MKTRPAPLPENVLLEAADPMRRHPDAPQFGRIGRRGFLGVALGGTALAGLGGSVQAASDVAPLEEVTPEYLTSAEWTMMLALCDILIPADGEGPGALEARVPVFIDRQLAGDWGAAKRWYMEGPHQPDADPLQGYQTPLTPAEIYRQGLAHFNDWCSRTHDAVFTDLDSDTRHEAVAAFMDDKTGLPAQLRDFPDLLLQNVKEGYLSDPRHGGNHGMAAWVYIGYPGARANFPSWTNPERDEAHYPLGPVDIAGERV